jgi:hypothetical protein
LESEVLIVSDTSAVSSLLQIERCDLLNILFGRVVVAPAVQSELLQFHASLPAFLEIGRIRDVLAVDALADELDRGEAESIVLAAECNADYLLIDEKRGRAAAKLRGLQIIGLLGVLLIAKREGQIASVAEVVADLESRAGFFVSSSLRQAVLVAAGETPSQR